MIHVKTLQSPQALAYLVLAAAYGGSSDESSTSSGQLGLWSKTRQATRAGGSTLCKIPWSSSAMVRYRSRLARLMSEHRIFDPHLRCGLR